MTEQPHRPRQYGTEALRRAVAEHTAHMDTDPVELAVEAGVRRDAAELLAGDVPATLEELLDLVLLAATGLDELVEISAEVRHTTEDAAELLELHAISSNLGQAWAYALAAAQTASELVATRGAAAAAAAAHDL